MYCVGEWDVCTFSFVLLVCVWVVVKLIFSFSSVGGVH